MEDFAMRISRWRSGFVVIAFSAAVLAAVAAAVKARRHGMQETVGSVGSSFQSTSCVIQASLPKVLVGKACQVTVSVDNPTGDALRLKGIDLGCACLAASLDPQELSPGEKGNLTVKFRGAEKAGPFGQRIILHLSGSSSAERVVNVLVQGEALSWAAVEPEVVNFGELECGQKVSARLRVRRSVDGKVTIREGSSRVSAVAAAPRATASRVEEFLVGFTVDPHATAGPGREEVRLLLDGDGAKPIIVPLVYVTKSPPVSLVPGRIILTDVRAGATVLTNVTLLAADSAHSLRAPSVRHSLGTALECETARADGSLKLQVRFRPEGPKRFWMDNLVLDFGDFSVALPFIAHVSGDAEGSPDARTP
jgi:hypothetical protein